MGIGNMKQMIRIWELCMILVLSINYTYGQFYHNDALACTTSKEIFLRAYPSCTGQVKYQFGAEKDFSNVKFRYNGGSWFENEVFFNVSGASISANSAFSADEVYTWIKEDWPNYDGNATVEIQITYNTISCGLHSDGTTLYYSHNGDNDGVFTADFESVGISTNNYGFIYTGTDLTTLSSNATSYNYKFYKDYNNSTQTGDLLVSGNALTINDYIGGSNVNPYFYCCAGLTGVDQTVNPYLYVSVNYLFSGQADNETISFTMGCPKSAFVQIVLDDLCTLLTDFEVNHDLGEDEFNVEANCSDVGTEYSDLEPFITDITLNFGDGSSVTNLSPGDVQTHTYASGGSNPYQNYTVDETVTFKGGCYCTSSANYDTGDPCNNMGNLTLTYEFDSGTGEYVYTLTPSGYIGGASVTDIDHYVIDWGDGTTSTISVGETATHVYQDDGNYIITQFTYFKGVEAPCLTYLGGPDDNAGGNAGGVSVSTYCCENFAPEDNKSYWVSAWVKEDVSIQVKTYSNTLIEVEFLGSNPNTFQFHPTGDIIEGWQRIVGKFVVPAGSSEMKLHLVNSDVSVDAYFDDVRIHPFNASMKSYVYDPETLWLTAELDDNNFATFYEYDKEGQLIRIKKETARGVMTIQESRSSNPKIME